MHVHVNTMLTGKKKLAMKGYPSEHQYWQQLLTLQSNPKQEDGLIKRESDKHKKTRGSQLQLHVHVYEANVSKSLKSQCTQLQPLKSS